MTPRNEPKSIVSLTQMVTAVGTNISEQATGKKGVHDIPKHIMVIGMFPLGSKRGVFNFNRMTNVDASVPQKKTAMRDDTNAAMNGSKCKIEEMKGGVKKVEGFTGLAQGCCCCLPMHYNKQKPFDEARFEKSRDAYNALYNPSA